MSISQGSRRLFGAALLAALLGLPGLAGASEGLVLFVSGEVSAQRGDRVVALRRGVRVREGDTIRTGPGGRTHIRMRDRTLFSLRPDTEFTIETYSYEGPEVAAGVAPASLARSQPEAAQGRSVYNLLRGGFRAITGLIGKVDSSAFSVRTPVATIGIRGTTFTAVCLADCSSGLVFGVSEGMIEASNDAGTLLLAENEFGFASSSQDPPRQLRDQPPQLLDITPAADGEQSERDPQQRRRVAARRYYGRSEPAANEEQPLGREDTVTEENEPTTRWSERVVLLSTAAALPHPGAPPIVAGNVPAGQVRVEEGELAGTTLVGFSARNEERLALLRFAGAAEDPLVSTNQGFDPVSGLRWGRYAEGTVTIREGDQVFSAQASEIGPHWIVGPQMAANAALPSTGTAEFTLVGNTDPTASDGARGFLGSATLQADFTALSVRSTLALGIDGNAWQASGEGAFGARLGPGIAENVFAGLYDSVQVNGVGGGDGQFQGLVSVQPEGVSGAALGYRLSAPESGSVAGVAIFRNASAP